MTAASSEPEHYFPSVLFQFSDIQFSQLIVCFLEALMEILLRLLWTKLSFDRLAQFQLPPTNIKTPTLQMCRELKISFWLYVALRVIQSL